MIFRFIYIIFFITLLSCGNEPTKTTQTANNNEIASNFSALATEYCSCSTELLALNKKAKYLAAHPEDIKNLDEISDLLAQSEELSQKQITCQTTLEQKYQTKIADNAAILAAIKIACPDLGDFMENAKKIED
jgi:cell division protein FtsI/penicillin-binding protein 2